MGLLILIAALLAVDAPQFQVDTVDGQSAVGALVQLNGQEVVVKTAGGDRTFKLSEVRFVGPPLAAETAAGKTASAAGQPSKSGETPAVVLETLDGARLSGARLRSDERRRAAQAGVGRNARMCRRNTSTASNLLSAASRPFGPSCRKTRPAI